MPGRTWIGAAGGYRYSHNGHEKEDEIFNGAQSAEYWMYDSRILRRWELDPLVDDDQSPYACFYGNPIYFADPLGLKGDDVIAKDTKTGEMSYHKDANGKDLIQYAEGTWNEDHTGFVASKTTIIESGSTGSASRNSNTNVTPISNNFNCHGTPTNKDISENYYKDLLSKINIEGGQLLPSRSFDWDGLRQAENGTYVNSTGYPATPTEIWRQKQVDADIAPIEMLEGPGGGYRSFRAFKRANGAAGEGNAAA